MKKKWYEITQELGIDLDPIIWFLLSAGLIFCGILLIKNEQTAGGTLFIALGGAGITRVRGSRVQRKGPEPPKEDGAEPKPE
jgi:hypothetical protein